MRKNPRRILSPQRLPFRHPGDWRYKFNQRQVFLQPDDKSIGPAVRQVVRFIGRTQLIVGIR